MNKPGSVVQCNLDAVRSICARHQIEVKKLTSVFGSFDKRIYFINNELLLRASAASMAA